MKTKSLFLVLFSLLPLSKYAQEMSRSVLASAGDFATSTQFGDIHWTLGEVAVAYFPGGDLQVAEGFHQLYVDLLVSTDQPPVEDWDVNVYPIPTADRLFITTPSGENCRLELFGATGQLIRSASTTDSDTEWSIAELPPGAYWLLIWNEEGARRQFQIQKIRR